MCNLRIVTILPCLVGQNNFSYCRAFQWSSSPLLDLISIDQLFVLDNVISVWVFHIPEHPKGIHVPLHIDTLPCDTTEDGILAALMQLLPWVCVCVFVFIYLYLQLETFSLSHLTYLYR